jgi:hypothetical protein
MARAKKPLQKTDRGTGDLPKALCKLDGDLLHLYGWRRVNGTLKLEFTIVKPDPTRVSGGFDLAGIESQRVVV